MEISLIIKVLNLFVLKGFKQLIRAVLAMLSLHASRILSLKSQEDIYEFLQEFIGVHSISHVNSSNQQVNKQVFHPACLTANSPLQQVFLNEMETFKVTRRLIKDCESNFTRLSSQTHELLLFDLIRSQHNKLTWFNSCG